MSLSEVETIKNFYDGSEIFITGGTGYIGKVLIEKLLRSCTRIKSIYLLLRPKKDKTAAERIQEMSDCMLFDMLKEENPFAFEKLHVIQGDVGELNLGICDSDLDTLKTCSVIFHVAASVRFDDPLKSAILLNTRGTREMCKLAQTMPHLKALVHVSTAYINPRNLHVKEKIYPTDANWKTYIELAENLDEDLLNLLTPKLTRFAPNTYTYTKHMAEHVCIDFKKTSNLPLVIFRPSIVSVSESEPIQGWCDNFNGPMALVMVGALGINHVTVCNERNVMDVIPVDVCVKGMIVAALSIQKIKDKEKIPILNAASIKLLTYRSMIIEMSRMAKEIPSINMFGIPRMRFTTCVYYAWILRIFRGILPALILDGIFRLTGNKPKLMKVQRINFNAEKSLNYFYTHSFKFDNFNFIDLNLDIPAHEKDEFSINDKFVTTFKDFYFNGFRTCKKVLLGETEKDEEIARRRYPYIYVITRTINVLFFFMCYKLLVKLFTIWF